jgi:hypothetical protein
MRGWWPGARAGLRIFTPPAPNNYRNIRNNCRKPCGTRQGPFRITRNTSATQAKLAGDSVAQRELNRIAPATPDVLPLLECCGVADKTAIFRGLPGDEFIGSLPDFLPELPCRRRAKYFLKNLFTAKRVSITVLGLQEKQVPWMRTPDSDAGNATPMAASREPRHLGLPPESL